MRLPQSRAIRAAAISAVVALILALIGVNAWYSNPAGESLPAPPPVPPSTSREPRLKADDVLSKLKPGMLRVDVESLLGPPTAVDSVSSNKGRIIYRATFTRDALRPPLPPIVLEFDATQPGHPLIIVKPM